MKASNKVLTALALLMVFFAAWGKDNLPTLRNTYDIKKIKFRDVDNEFVKERFLQTANEVDFDFCETCEYMVSDKLSIGGNDYRILCKDYFDRAIEYYLCREPIDSYPQMVLLCLTSTAAETFQYFEIDEENDCLTISDHMLNHPLIDIATDKTVGDLAEFDIKVTSFRLSPLGA